MKKRYIAIISVGKFLREGLKMEIKRVSIAIAVALCVGLAGCAAGNEAVILNPVKDRAVVVFDSIEVTERESGKQVITGAKFKIENVSETKLAFKDLHIIGYDGSMKPLEITSENTPAELAPGEQSEVFEYVVNGDAEFLKLVGYQYEDHERTYIDPFETVIGYHGGESFRIDVNEFSDEEISEAVRSD